MAVARGRARAGRRVRTAAAAAPRAIGAGELAWLLAVPCAAVAVGAIVTLGPPLGRALLTHHPAAFWPSQLAAVRPEPTEQARYLLALGAPLLLTASLVAATRRSWRIDRKLAARLAWCVQGIAVAFAIACLIAQRRFAYGPTYTGSNASFHQQYFTTPTLIASVVGAIVLLTATRSGTVREHVCAWAREARGWRAAATLAAVLATAVWLLHAFNTEGTIGAAHYASAYHIQFTLDETIAVLDGRTPLVDFVAQYAFLWPYPVAAAMALLGTSIGVFTALMCTLSGLSMLAVYGVLRRVAHSARAGLLLFLPFLATSFFMLRGPLENRYTFANIFADYPLRFAGPWLLAWMTARHLDGARPRARWPLFLVAGLVMLNNVDHGVPAFGAVLAALLWAAGRPSRASLSRLALELLGGLAGAFALVAALTLARAGALPDPGVLLGYTRLFAGAGYAMLPMPTLGFHTIIYLTFVAALTVATVRALAGEQDRLLTGMLAWSGAFGLGAGAYYAGRSHPEVLVASFSVWALATALLLVIVLRHLAARPSWWPAPAEAACVVAFCIAACSLAQTPTPWSQLRRLQHAGPHVLLHPLGEALATAFTHRGESVALLVPLGHRLAYDLGINDVTPYTGPSILTEEQLTDTVRALREAGGRKVFVSRVLLPDELAVALQRDGFRVTKQDDQGTQLWIRA